MIMGPSVGSGEPKLSGSRLYRHRGVTLRANAQCVQVRKLNRRWAEGRLPKIGAVRFRLSRPLGGMVRNATVRRDGLTTPRP
jgi:putative transposase